MKRVLIVGKTEKWDKVCVGGLVLDTLKAVRLLTATGDDQPSNTFFELGSVWDITFDETQADQNARPHVEDVKIVEVHNFVAGWFRNELLDFLVKHVDVPVVNPVDLFCGLLQFTDNRKWYVAPNSGLPEYSTGFWWFRKALRLFWVRNKYDKSKPRYIYLDDNANNPTFDVPYVGLEKPLEVIPSGTLLRFSLAQPFSNDRSRRCYLQLSGWFL